MYCQEAPHICDMDLQVNNGVIVEIFGRCTQNVLSLVHSPYYILYEVR